jgi:hypothetical protein
MSQNTAERDNRSKGWAHRTEGKWPLNPTRLTVKLTKEEAGLLSALSSREGKHPAAYLRDHIREMAGDLQKAVTKELEAN